MELDPSFPRRAGLVDPGPGSRLYYSRSRRECEPLPTSGADQGDLPTTSSLKSTPRRNRARPVSARACSLIVAPRPNAIHLARGVFKLVELGGDGLCGARVLSWPHASSLRGFLTTCMMPYVSHPA